MAFLLSSQMGAESSEEIAEWFRAFTCSLGKPLDVIPDTWPSSASMQIGCFTEPHWGDSRPTNVLRMEVESPLIQMQRERPYTSLGTPGPGLYISIVPKLAHLSAPTPHVGFVYHIFCGLVIISGFSFL
jgi:hypothetical protein